MATIKLGENQIDTAGNLPDIGETVPNFELINQDLETISLDDFKGSRIIMNIFPSIDTNVCATSVRKFNEKATGLENTKVLSISRDLPFAQKRFNDDENIENVTNLSDFQDGNFGKSYGVEMINGPLKGLLSRAVLVVDQNAKVLYREQVEDIGNEPNYLAALKVLL